MDDHDETVRDLMTKLMEAVEASLASSGPVRDALAELSRRGYDAKLFFVANAEAAGEAGPAEDADAAEVADAGPAGAAQDGDDVEVDEDEAAALVRGEWVGPSDDDDLRFELTKRDQDFLKSLSIRPETG
jgi:hypothetical protein